MSKTPFPLGRLPALDVRDRAFPLRQLLAAAERLAGYQYWWANGGWFDQGSRPTCVGASAWHWLVDAPVTKGAAHSPEEIYALAQELDEWPGATYDGTSVRGAAKALAQLGYISSYWWAWDLDTIVRALLNRGPIVLGTNWYAEMFNPPASGVVTLGGSLAGGHAYVADGVNTTAQLVRCKNSWSREWGRRGFFYLRFPDLQRLLVEEGEAMVALETRL